MSNFLLAPWTTPKLLLTPLQEIVAVAEVMVFMFPFVLLYFHIANKK